MPKITGTGSKRPAARNGTGPRLSIYCTVETCRRFLAPRRGNAAEVLLLPPTDLVPLGVICRSEGDSSMRPTEEGLRATVSVKSDL